MGRMSSVAECAKNKFINQYLKLPGKIGEPVYCWGNEGYTVLISFTDNRYPDVSLAKVVKLSWDEIDAWNKRQTKRLAT